MGELLNDGDQPSKHTTLLKKFDEMITFKDYKDGKASITEFADSIKKDLPVTAFFLLSRDEIVWQALSLLKMRGLKNTPDGISSATRKIIEVEPFLKDTDNDPVDVFMKAYLDLKKLPVTVKIELETEAKKQLHSIEILLEHYKELPIVKKNSLDPEKPRNHEERTQLEFYRRTLLKKEQIVQYLTSGAIDARAIEKSAVLFKAHHNEETKDVLKQILYHNDFPYTDLLINNNKIEFGIDMEKLDYRLINTIRNKFSWVNGKYKRNGGYSKAFIKATKLSVKPKDFFKGLMKDLKSVPIVSGREKIFKELKALFSNENWYGFYALALPQVEGIFNEMVELVNLKKSSGTLTDKVHIVRPFYDNSAFYFDYYEYFLPNWRNHFAHSGKVEDAKIKSYYLLLDLKDLLITCISLNSPMSRIAAMVKQGSDGVSHIGNLSELLSLIKDLEGQKTLTHVQRNLDHFMYKDVVAKINLKMFFEKLRVDFSLALSKFEYHLELGMHATSQPIIKIFQLKPAQLTSTINQIEKAYEAYSFLMDEDLKLLLDTNNVLHYFEKYFPKLPQPILDLIHGMQKDFEGHLKALSRLNAQAKFELPDDYLLHKRTMTHVIS